MENKNIENTENNEVEIFTLQDEEGNEHEFELIGTCEQDGTKYYAMIPADEKAGADEEIAYVILKNIIENGEETLVTIDDDEEFDRIADYFDDLFASEIDYDAE